MNIYRLGIKGILFNKDDISADVPNVYFITQADYKALEERSEYFRKEWNKAEGEVIRLDAELASLKSRVAELVEADKAYLDGDGDDNPDYRVIERRRLALEPFK
ncbi:MAG: hypothetical protein AAGC76_09685 [Luteibacter sp.]|uniref:hypothetical protein n=1 Tax=Luteibacter sp. TaxID=1886636 RepID=UPI0028075836|nr:hypothetical protein [Luteibacter sp.]MDQ7996112.1 hypothetical protein [Luteibacter sp.]